MEERSQIRDVKELRNTELARAALADGWFARKIIHPG